MSDARPITNITDFVCGNCWATFSRNDPGVQDTGEIICPHCHTPLPSGDAESQLSALVRAAPSFDDPDSAEYAAPRANSVRDTTDFDAQTTGLAPRAPTGIPAREQAGWLPPDAWDAVEPEPQSVAVGGQQSLIPSDTAAASGGYVVGAEDDVDDEFGGHERTLSGSHDDDELLRSVRETSPVPRVFVAGDELSVNVDEPTPIDVQAIDELENELRGLDAGLAARAGSLSGGGTDEATSAAGESADSDPTDAQDATDSTRSADLAHRDWKLKAMGITYNFHGLDPLFSWAANKSGQAMSLSYDGDVWKDFHSFYASIRVGLSVRQAFDEAPDPGSAAPPPTTPRVTRTMNQLRPELPELEGLRLGGEAGRPDLGPVRSPSNPSVLASAAPSGSTGAQRSTATGSQPLLRSGSRPSSTSIPASAMGGSRTGSNPRNLASISPSSSPSKRMPVAAATPAPGPNKAIIAAVVAVVLILGTVVGLHLTHVIRIPGLP